MSSTQLVKDYKNDWAKAKSRTLLRDVIGRTLLKFKDPRELRVLCFPGVDAAEIFEVYDALGIPRQNITGIERDLKVAEEISRKELGIQLIREDLEDFVEREDKFDLDIVSLDYTGPINNKQMDILEKISRNQRRNHWVLHQANLAKRDRNSNGNYLSGFAFSDGEDERFPSSRIISERINLFLGSPDQRKENKSVAYSTLLRSTFLGATAEVFDRLYKFSCGEDYKIALDIIESKSKKIFGEDFVLDRDNPMRCIMNASGNLPHISRSIEDDALANLELYLQKYGLHPSLKIPLSAAINDLSKEKFFREKDMEAYSYVSESGDPMMGNIYFLSYPEGYIRAARELALTVGFPEGFKIRNVRDFLKKMQNFGKQAEKFLSRGKIKELIEKGNQRIYLGSSSKPILTKKKAIEEFESGATVEELKEKYRGWKGKPLSQWKAHVTMGTYKGLELCGIQPGSEDSDLEKITKDEAIDLLQSGIPLEEITSAYPTSFTLGQLRAYKAHLTMGSYEQK